MRILMSLTMALWRRLPCQMQMATTAAVSAYELHTKAP
jgi:hypothetical protein